MGEDRHARIGCRGPRPHRLPTRGPMVAHLYRPRGWRKHAVVRVACAEPRGAVGTARIEPGEGGHPILEARGNALRPRWRPVPTGPRLRSEEHTSELQSRLHLVCRLLL